MEEEVKPESSQQVVVEEPKSTSIMKKFPKPDVKGKAFLVLGTLFMVVVGIGTGWILSGGLKNKPSTSAPGSSVTSNGEVTEAGVENGEEFTDTAEGLLEEGGIEGEGTHHLVREGGPAKYVYMTSTVINLQQFAGKEVQVWGETIAGQNAPWLMDVGKIKVVD